MKVRWRKRAERDLDKIGNEKIKERIRSQTEKALSKDPFFNGEELNDNWKGFWKYKIKDKSKGINYRAIYEIIYKIEEDKKEVLVAKVGKRTETGQPDDVYMGYHPHPSKNRITERPKARDLKRKVGKIK